MRVKTEFKFASWDFFCKLWDSSLWDKNFSFKLKFKEFLPTNFKHLRKNLHNKNSSKVYENLPQKSLWKRFLDSQPASFDFLNALSDHLSYLFALLVWKFHSELFRDLCFASRSLSQQIFFHISKISKPRDFDFWIRNLFVSDSSCDSSAEIFAIFAFNSSRRFSSFIWESFLIAFLGPESFNSSETSWFFLFLGFRNLQKGRKNCGSLKICAFRIYFRLYRKLNWDPLLRCDLRLIFELTCFLQLSEKVNFYYLSYLFYSYGRNSYYQNFR